MQKVLYLIFALFILVADQLSKWAVLEHIIRPMSPDTLGHSLGLIEWLTSAPERLPFASMKILPFFNIVMVWNKGVSFGLFSNGADTGALWLSMLAIAIIIVFTVWLFRTDNKMQLFSIALVIGGAMGNVMDRLRFGAVADFLDFHAFGWHYPAFNISDSCIVIGVFLLIIQSINVRFDFQVPHFFIGEGLFADRRFRSL